MAAMALRGAIAFLAALPALALAPQEELEFRPAPESSAVKSIEAELELECQRMEADFRSNGPVILDYGHRLIFGQSLVFHDEYEAVDQGQIETLRRCFERLEIRAESEFLDESFEERSPLEGACVSFAREGALGELEVAYAEADRYRDEEWIRGLEADMDFQEFLPGREVAPGDRWRIPGSVIAELLFPGGRIPFVLEDDYPREWLGDLRGLVGDVEVELLGISVHGGVDLAELRVHGEAEGETRWTEEEPYPLPFMGDDRPALVERAVETSWTLRGDLLWDVDLGRFDRASFGGDVAIGLTEVADIEGLGEVRLDSTWKGSFLLQATAAEPEPED
jgi:hypothetical protein